MSNSINSEEDDHRIKRKPYDMGERLFWWIRFWMAVLAVAGFGLAVGRWALTRASVEYVDQSVSTRETIENVKKVDEKIDDQQKVLGNVRDNLIILMDRQRIKSNSVLGHSGRAATREGSTRAALPADPRSKAESKSVVCPRFLLGNQTEWSEHPQMRTGFAEPRTRACSLIALEDNG